MDGQPQIGARERTVPGLPMQPRDRRAVRRHDCIRHGASTPSAALDLAHGPSTAVRPPRPRHQQFLPFLGQVARSYPDQHPHRVPDHYVVHRTRNVRTWQAEYPGLPARFTPASASWLRSVEIGRGIVERRTLRRSEVGSVAGAMERTRFFVTGCYDCCIPCVRTRPVLRSLEKCRSTTWPTGRQRGGWRETAGKGSRRIFLREPFPVHGVDPRHSSDTERSVDQGHSPGALTSVLGSRPQLRNFRQSGRISP